ncbi:universal stress protein [Acidipila rosea]|uniref:Nucleotide-binding universal stress UspA family protein n=1 Tax=Acidipila rosea TaxID=768535 RepID=A0A4R1L9Y9_9BACT|nr:universal stress protein [Acidipila rosea]MBW4028671.1 universal stress protein [Acidobacteriota bacterium]MBW4043491.1 universal stress protein [Acidobacteriota bacterium]TCK73793.1 nucleotide-binding universal stress UspA family protein [Acidipila rosea]
MEVIGDRPEISFDPILFATDLLPDSYNAGEYALLLAKHFSATVHIVHAFTISQPAMEVEAARKVLSRQRADLQHQLDHIASNFAAQGIKVVTELVDGDPETVIPKVAVDMDASLIVLGTHGGNRFDRHTIGSVSEAVLLHARLPTLTVGPLAVHGSSVKLPLRRILYATDLSAFASKAAPYAVALAEYFGAELDVLNVVPESSVEHPERWSELSEKFYRRLETVVPDHAREFCDPHTFVEVGRAREQIVKHIVEREINLLVLGIQRVDANAFQLRTSSAFHMILEAKCPVLTIAG